NPRTQAWSGATSGVHLRGSVLILNICPSRTWALTTQRPPQLWPQVLVTMVSPGAAAGRGASYRMVLSMGGVPERLPPGGRKGQSARELGRGSGPFRTSPSNSLLDSGAMATRVAIVGGGLMGLSAA